MKTDIQDALSSVTEVAIFAWTLIELLFTRILPLVGFLTGYLFLQFGSLLSSVVAPAARRRRKLPGEYSWDHVSQAEDSVEEEDTVQVVKEDEYSWDASQAKELVEKEEKVQVVKKEDDDQKNIVESLKSFHAEPEEINQRISREEASLLPSLLEEEDEEAKAAATIAEAALSKSAPRDQGPVTKSHDPGNEKQSRGSDQGHVAESPQPDVRRVDLPTSDTSEKHADEASKKQFKFAEAGVEAGYVSSKAESKMDLEPSDSQPSKEAESSGSSRKMSGEGEGAEMQKSSSRRGSKSRILRVLPPSLFQIKRILRQRSRRVTISHAEEAEWQR